MIRIHYSSTGKLLLANGVVPSFIWGGFPVSSFLLYEADSPFVTETFHTGILDTTESVVGGRKHDCTHGQLKGDITLECAIQPDDEPARLGYDADPLYVPAYDDLPLFSSFNGHWFYSSLVSAEDTWCLRGTLRRDDINLELRHAYWNPAASYGLMIEGYKIQGSETDGLNLYRSSKKYGIYDLNVDLQYSEQSSSYWFPEFSVWKEVDESTPLLKTLTKEALDLVANGLIADAVVQSHSVDVASLYVDACESLQYVSTNWVENAVQATDLTDMIPIEPIVRILRDPDNPKQWIKSAADLYLVYKYAWKPTISDIREIVHLKKKRVQAAQIAAKKSNAERQVIRGSQNRILRHAWTSRSTCQICLHTKALTRLAQVANTLDKYGLLLTLQRAWDLVPFSFVADWFANTSEFFGYIDDAVRLSAFYDVEWICTSTKLSKDVTEDLLELFPTGHGSVRATYYTREYSLGFLPPTLAPRTEWSRHSFEGGALIAGLL